MYQNLKNLRMSLDMTQEEFGKSVGIAKTTYSNYEQGIREPKSDFWISVANKYNVTIDYLIGRCGDPHDLYQENKIKDTNHETNTHEESEIIKKYRSLDQNGQETVKNTLNHEVERVQAVQALAEQIKRLKEQLEIAETKVETTRDTDVYRYPYLRKIACAGTGFLFDDIPTDTIDVPYMYGADCIIGVNGDSMEPTYCDGDLLYVRKTNELQYGDIGIFTYAGECFVKEYGRYGLISHNPDYPNITGNEDIRIVGEVIGKVEE